MTEPTATGTSAQPFDVCIVGGAGHVGLPLGLVLADVGQRVLLFDVNRPALDKLASGEMPFLEYDAEPVLRRALANDTLHFTDDPRGISSAQYVIVTIGTPVDEYLSPKFRVLQELFRDLRPHLHPRQTIIICSTVQPGSCRQLLRFLESDGTRWNLGYCPERIAQGYAIRELRQLPQIVSGFTDEALRRATELFARIAPEVLPLSVEEAELAKLFTNTWRYIQFAAANQFYMTATQLGADFHRIRAAMLHGYERANTLPGPGFAAGPCLLKDTMQLAAAEGSFLLGHAAMMVNEGLPAFLVERIKARRPIAGVKVGILGMAFKKDVDDTRDSLSFKLAKLLRFNEAEVICSDEFARHASFVSKEDLVRGCDVIIVGVPHSAYQGLKIPAGKDVVDLWGVLPNKSELARRSFCAWNRTKAVFPFSLPSPTLSGKWRGVWGKSMFGSILIWKGLARVFRSETFALPDAKIHVSLGPASGPPLLLLHGVARNWRDFRPLFPWLTSGWQVFGWDHRGHGLSDRAPNYLVVDYAKDIVAWLEHHAPPEGVAIYGHSLGALSALYAAANLPDRVRAVVLEEPPSADFSANLAVSPYQATFSAMQRLARRAEDAGKMAADLAETRVASPDGLKRLGDLRDGTSLRFSARSLQQVDPQVFTPLLAGRWLQGYDFPTLLGAVRCPVLLLAGSQVNGGMMGNDDAEQMAGALSQATLIKPPGAGHLIHWQFIEQTARYVLGFLESI